VQMCEVGSRLHEFCLEKDQTGSFVWIQILGQPVQTILIPHGQIPDTRVFIHLLGCKENTKHWVRFVQMVMLVINKIIFSLPFHIENRIVLMLNILPSSNRGFNFSACTSFMYKLTLHTTQFLLSLTIFAYLKT